MPMQVNQRGKNLFKEWEDLVTHMYLDSGGAPTIDIGHLLTQSERASGKIILRGQSIRYRDGLTEQQCWDLLDQDLDPTERTVNDAVTVPLNQNQFNALVSFTFNVGDSAFRGSTLLKLLNQSQYGEVPAQMRRWNKDNGHVVRGLINRSEKEIALWNTPA
jgi:lysozyme